jgi:hypothetical protein
LNKSAAIPEKMHPITNPTGFPALKHAKAIFFLLEGCSYAAPRIPTAGGTAAADQRPKIPQKTSRYIALVANPAIRLDTAKAPMAKMRSERRPKVSATLEKNRRKAPEPRLFQKINNGLHPIRNGTSETYAEDAPIHVICADVMFKSRPICAVITTHMPKRNEVIPIAIVAVRTNNSSCRVDLKYFGLPPLFDFPSTGDDPAGGSIAIVAEVESMPAMVLNHWYMKLWL